MNDASNALLEHFTKLGYECTKYGRIDGVEKSWVYINYGWVDFYRCDCDQGYGCITNHHHRFKIHFNNPSLIPEMSSWLKCKTSSHSKT